MRQIDPFTTLHNKVPCRICGTTHDAATSMGRAAWPDSGSFSVCVTCGEISVFEVSALGQVALREATLAEVRDFTRDHPDAVQRIIALNAMRRDAR